MITLAVRCQDYLPYDMRLSHGDLRVKYVKIILGHITNMF